MLYHSIGNSEWATSAKDFQEQINWLSDHCKVSSLTNLINHQGIIDDIQVGISFDDGYSSLYDESASILNEKNINPIVYLNTDWIAENDSNRRNSVAQLGHYPNEKFLTWKEVQELSDLGWEIGSHGANHLDFTQCEPNLVKDELKKSKFDIEKRLNKTCDHFSYPWGKHTLMVKTVVKELGYKYAVGGCHAPINNQSNPFALPRINISKNYSFQDFKAIIKGKWDFLGIFQKMKGM